MWLVFVTLRFLWHKNEAYVEVSVSETETYVEDAAKSDEENNLTSQQLNKFL